MLADEAGRTAIPNLADDATTVRSRGITLWIAVQDLSQLETIYGKSRAQTLLNNMDTKLFYRPNDIKTAEHLEQLLGRKSGFARSIHERYGDETSQGHAEQAIPLLSSRNIMELADEDIIAIHRNLPPIRATRMDWRDHPELAQRRSLTPVATKPITGLERTPVFIDDDDEQPAPAEEKAPHSFTPVTSEKLTGWHDTPGGTIYEGGQKKPHRPKRVD